MSYSVQKGKKEGTSRVLIFLKCYNKVELMSYMIENAKIRYSRFKKLKGTAGVLVYLKC